MMKKTSGRKSRWTVPLRGKIKCRALKGACHEILHPLFFLDSNPPRPLINRLKYFQIRLDFAEISDLTVKVK